MFFFTCDMCEVLVNAGACPHRESPVYQVTIPSLKPCVWNRRGAPRQDKNKGQNLEGLSSDLACVPDSL